MDKRKREKIENRGFLAFSVLVLSTTILLILWALFFVVSFANALVKIGPVKKNLVKEIKNLVNRIMRKGAN